MSDNHLLQLIDIASGYGRMEVLSGVSLRVDQGQIVTLLGSNGVGKTTTLKTIAGLIKPQKGRILYEREELTGLPAHRVAQLGVVYCPEGRRIFGNLTALENLRIGAYTLKTFEEFKRNLEWVYAMFPRLRERRSQLAESLSGGEQQMLAIGRALISSPKLMLLDEPSLGLAPILVQLIAETLAEINRRGVSILLVEQNAKLALDISHFAYVMDKGTLVLEGDSQNLKKDERVMDIYLGGG
jgi:branched-chain amino acid transport system ATP-binding protein